MTRTIGVGVGGGTGVTGIGRYHTKAIEACQFLAPAVSGAQGEPGLREALAFARVQETITRSRESRHWEPGASEGVTT